MLLLLNQPYQQGNLPSPWADLIRPSSCSTDSEAESLDRRVKPADGEGGESRARKV